MHKLKDLKAGALFSPHMKEYEVLGNRYIHEKWGEMVYCLNIKTRIVEEFQVNTMVNFKHMLR